MRGTVIDLRAGEGKRTPEEAAFLLALLNGDDTDLRGNVDTLEHDEGLFSFPGILVTTKKKLGYWGLRLIKL